jgi:phosphate transport system substrate-binding protein
MRKFFVFLCLSSFVFLLVFFLVFSVGRGRIIEPCGVVSEKEKSILRSGGSTSMSRLLGILGEEFSKRNLDKNVEKSETGSGAAITETLSGKIDLGDISRELKETETPEKFNKVVIALDGIAIVVNSKNPVENLRKEEIIKIFCGEIKKWNEICDFNERVAAVGREESSGTREGFEGVFGIYGKTKYSAEFPESGDIIAKIGSEPGGIGYVSLASVSGNVRTVSVDGIQCSVANIENKSYPITRPFLQIYLKKDPPGTLIEKWFEFIKSLEGAAIIRREKFIPVS